MATYTIYADASDGYLLSTHATYSTADAGSSPSVNNSGSTLRIGQQWNSFTSSYNLYQSYLSFDTSVVDDGENIASAVLQLYCSQDNTADDFDILVKILDWGASLEATDWVDSAEIAALTTVASLNSSGIAVSAYNDLAWSAGLASIDKGGATRVVACSGQQGVQPTTTEWIVVGATDASGTTIDPKLVVVTAVEYSITADGGVFDMTGQGATLKLGRAVAANSGGFALTGQDTALKRSRVMPASTGAFSLTGIAASLRKGRNLTANAGAFTLTGFAASLRRTYQMAADAGAFVLTGIMAGLYRGRRMGADAGAFAMTGQPAGLLYGRSLAAEGGVLSLTGQDAELTRTRLLTADAGGFDLVGQDAGLRYTRIMVAGTGAFELTGFAATLFRTAAPDAFARPISGRIVGAGYGSSRSIIARPTQSRTI